MHFIRLCGGVSVRHVPYGKENKKDTGQPQRGFLTRLPLMTQVILGKLFHLLAQFCFCRGSFQFRISGSKVHFLLPATCCSEIRGPLPHDLTPCESMCSKPSYFLSVNSILSSRMSSVSLYYPGPIVSTQILQMSGFICKEKSTVCLLPVLFLELLEFGDWVSS